MTSVEIEASMLADMRIALIAYKFKLCTPPNHDGRHDVYLAMVARRDAQLECVKKLLNDTAGISTAAPTDAVKKAFS
jgi:hypothetical protein